MIQQFAVTTLERIQSKTEVTQNKLSLQISNMEKFFLQADETKQASGKNGNSIVTYKQFQAVENKVDQLITLQTELSAKIFEMNKAAKAAAKKKALPTKKSKPKPAPNTLKFP